MGGMRSDFERAGIRREIISFSKGIPERRKDWVTVEEPLQIVVECEGRRTDLSVIMRTPAMDIELAAGFLYTEGIISSGEEILSIGYEHSGEGKDGNMVLASLAGSARMDLQERRFNVNSSCGICGKSSINELYLRGNKIVHSESLIRSSVIEGLPEKMRSGQNVFSRTGGIHAAGLFQHDGSLVVVREDIGRHNAVDKIAGHMLLNGIIGKEDLILQVSGRAGFEIVQKAVCMGIPVVSSISAPSSLAIETAEAFGITLICFVRDGRFNVYSHGERIAWGNHNGRA